jgi:KDO2-lipid IV(A) lauroyltransferase
MATTTDEREQPETLASRIGDTLKYWGFCTASWLTGHLPVRFSYWVGARIGDIIYLCWHEHSGNAVSNMLRVLGPDARPGAIKRAARQSFHNYIQVLIDFIRIPHMNIHAIEDEVQARGWEHLAAARARGKGVIVVASHSGNWDYAGAILGKYQLQATAIADPFQPQRLDDFVITQRQRMGIHTYPAEAASVRQLLMALKRNELVILHVDRPVPGEGVEVQFFGESAWVPSGPATIALKTGAAIVPGYFMRDPDNRHGFVGEFSPPLDYPAFLTGDKERDIQRISQEIMTYMEGVIRAHPTQWYMFRRMWPRIDLRERRFAVVGRALAQSRATVRRWRTRRAAPPRHSAVEGLGLGISVDPPVIEEWSSGQHPLSEAADPVPAPRPLEPSATDQPSPASH